MREDSHWNQNYDLDRLKITFIMDHYNISEILSGANIETTVLLSSCGPFIY